MPDELVQTMKFCTSAHSMHELNSQLSTQPKLTLATPEKHQSENKDTEIIKDKDSITEIHKFISLNLKFNQFWVTWVIFYFNHNV